MNDNKSIKPIVKEESDPLKLFNKWLRSNDYIPKYHSIKDVQTKMKISEAKAKEKVLNAYRYFALGLKQKGAAPDINTWIRLEIQPPEEPREGLYLHGLQSSTRRQFALRRRRHSHGYRRPAPH